MTNKEITIIAPFPPHFQKFFSSLGINVNEINDESEE